MVAYRTQTQRRGATGGSTRRNAQLSLAVTAAAITLVCLFATADVGFPARAAWVTSIAARVSDIPSHNRTYRASLVTPPDAIELNRPLTWTVEIRTPTGAPVDGADLSLEGWMPDDTSARVARPAAIAALGRGSYRVEGLRLDSRGWWNLKLEISAAGVTDSLAFNLVLR